jgi:hypothetical protein
LKTLKNELEKQEELAYHLNAKTGHLRVIETLFIAPSIAKEAEKYLDQNKHDCIDRNFCVPCSIQREFRPYKEFAETILMYAPENAKKTFIMNYSNIV